MVPPALLILQILVTLATGQLDPGIIDSEYDYEAAPIGEEEAVPFKDYIPIQGENGRKFLEGLVVEAGKRTLFPELYTPENEGTSVEPYNRRELPNRNKSPKFYEINGQPEYEEVYTNRRIRSGVLNCPDDCSVYKPLCGSDGKVYPSECHMLKENCGQNNVTKGSWSKCRGKHYLCPSHCLDINDPVCASDGRIYHNICILRKRNCGKLLQILPLKRCYDEADQRKLVDGCPTKCPEISKPVCGSNGVIYYNECFMKIQTCGLGVTAVSMAGCVFIPKCPEVCLPFHDPVCGSDGRIYINLCRMLQDNCG
ncbi:uncharacterized protein TNIN_304171 [Trichonephila inaurata madagascariensis]|uniref:Kazal-like domain-containing protein n=1 Tax=Trichonephila inaurata madagascariensis TaxID=2747483 RepID=A0A8X6XTG4_9ARAC|nr:uncharacterized protein TNIN_77621 [Trichonephila inaurata madagascariensis]GFY78248.1 uncharacterized protein TNIN_304171 [Trichonephila inaurata madagascariensis]